MKINDDRFAAQKKPEIKSALVNLISQPSEKQQRPCPGCEVPVGLSGSTTSTEQCNLHCPNAPKQMSSDPERYPIEPAIAPLVYAFYTLKLLTPCWSCEGHNDNQGNLLKTPKLWFYAADDFYARLVAQYVSSLKARRLLNHDWMITLLPFSQSAFTTTYCLEPAGVNTDMTTLHTLQQDVLTIAEHLRSELHELANHYIQRTES